MDAQVDPFQQSTIQMKGSPFDLPEGVFISGAEAWDMIRNQGVNPMRFGISGNAKFYNLNTLFGQWFARGNLLRDFAALNKVEDVPFLIRLIRDKDWSDWRLVGSSDEMLDEADLKLFDEVARISLDPDDNLDEIRKLYVSTPELQSPISHLCARDG